MLPEFPVTRTEQYLDYIARNGGGGGGLPAPEVADIGKVLGIVEDGAGAKYAPVDASGLPDPSSLPNGTAMVAVNGEWKMQEGYGYIGAPAFEPITWDGDKEGREAIELGGSPTLWKVSDAVLTGEMFSGAKARDNIGAVSDVVVLLSADGFVYAEAELIGSAIISGVQGEYSVGGDTVAVPSDGTYFMELGNDYVAELTAPSISHSINHTLMPEGYGYYGEPAFEPIEWDGDTEGRDAFTLNGTPSAYKVSDVILTAELLDGATSVTSTGNIGGFEVYGVTSFLMANCVADTGCNLISGAAGEYSEMGGTVVIPSDGTYFTYSNGLYISALTAPPSVHKFDPALIPTSGVEEFVVKFEMGDDGIVADATWEDVVMAVNSGKLAKGVFYEDGVPYSEFQFTGSGFVNISLGAQNTLQIASIAYDGTSVWSLNVANYTLTPAT